MSDDQQQIKGFTFVQGFDRQFEKIRNNADLTLKFLNALRDYWFRGVEPSFDDPLAELAWTGMDDLLVRTRQNRQSRSVAQLGNQNAKKRKETKENDEKRTETKETNGNERKQEKRIEENRREEDSRGEENISTPKPPVKSKPRARAYKTVADIKGAHPKAMAFWEAVRAVYPSHRRHAPADYTLCQIEQDGLCERQDEIVAIVKRFVAEDDEWKRGFVPRMGNFFKDQLWQNDPTPPKPPETIHRVVTNQAPMPSYTDTSDTPQF